MIVDVNVNLSRWPFRRLPLDDTAALVAALHKAGITEAWTASFDGLLHKDISGVNARIARECKDHGGGLLVPFGSINPLLPDWQEDLRRCATLHGMPGVRLHPNYHGYTLDRPEFAELLGRAGELDLIVQIVVRMEDPRTQHPLVRAADVDLKPLVPLVRARPSLRVVILNGSSTLLGETMGQLAAAGKVCFDFAMQEGIGGVAALLKLLPAERLLFGSHAPLFVLESSLLKLQESEPGEFQRTAILHANAASLRAGSSRGQGPAP